MATTAVYVRTGYRLIRQQYDIEHNTIFNKTLLNIYESRCEMFIIVL